MTTDTDARQVLDRFRIRRRPNYVPQADEQGVFRAAFVARIPLLLKGPTGCGKTRFIEFMACELDLPLERERTACRPVATEWSAKRHRLRT